MITKQKLVANKLGLPRPAQPLGNASNTWKIKDYSGAPYCRISDLLETGGELVLQKISRKKPHLKNRVDPVAGEAVLTFSFEKPTFGQLRMLNDLRKRAIIECTWGGYRHKQALKAARASPCDTDLKR